jgi:hypothetical protein
MLKIFNNLFNKITPIAIFFMIILVAGGMGQVARWDLLDQISMADNYIKDGSLYPSDTSAEPFGVSVYFPGVALLAIGLSKIGIGFYLVEVMILIACAIVILFLSIQKVLVWEISRIEITWTDIIIFSIPFCLIIAPNWLFYATEFKPDTIAFLLGFLGLILTSFLKSHTNFHKILLGSLFCSGALLFKQQYIAFIVGLILFCLFNLNRTRILFLICLCFFISCICLYFYNHANLWFWNVTVLSDDGFISFKTTIVDNYSTIIALLYFIFIGAALLTAKKDGFKYYISFNLQNLKTGLPSSPWLWVVIPSMLAGFAGALKVGGNSGNTQFGLIILLPLAIVLFSKVDRGIIFGIAWIALLNSLPTLYSGPLKYIEAVHLRAFIEKDLSNKPEFVLTGSDVYFASRLYQLNSKVMNYWTISLRAGSDVNVSLKDALLKVQPDRLVVENWPTNKAVILADSRYVLIYENKLGLIASLRSRDVSN